MATQQVSLRQRRNLGRILSDSFTIYGASFGVLVGTAAVLTPYFFISSIAGRNIFVSLLLFPLDLVVNALGSAAIVAAIDARDRGETPSVGSSYEVATSRAGDLVWASLRSIGIVLLLGITVVGIPWAIKRAVRWAFIVQAIVIDGRTHSQALDHSARVVEGHWWVTLGRLMLIFLVVSVLSIPGAMRFVTDPVLVAVYSAITLCLTLPYTTIGMTLVYFDWRMEKGPALWPQEPTP